MSGRLMIMGLIGLGLMACTSPKTAPQVRMGPTHSAINTCANLIRVTAETTAGGIAQEDAWIEQRYPGAVRITQSVTDCNGKPVDRITFRRNGEDMTVLFDISSYFGKVGEDDLDDLLDG